MLALGLLFIIVAAAVTAGAIYDGGESATFEVFGQTVGTTIGGVFVAGLATMLVFFLGVWLLMRSLSRSRRKRLERKDARNRQRESVSQIEEERARLRAENERLQERLSRDSRPGSTTATGSTAAAAHPDATPDDRPATLDRPDTAQDATGGPSDDRVIDHRTDLTPRDEPATSTPGRHQGEV